MSDDRAHSIALLKAKIEVLSNQITQFEMDLEHIPKRIIALQSRHAAFKQSIEMIQSVSEGGDADTIAKSCALIEAQILTADTEAKLATGAQMCLQGLLQRVKRDKAQFEDEVKALLTMEEEAVVITPLEALKPAKRSRKS